MKQPGAHLAGTAQRELVDAGHFGDLLAVRLPLREQVVRRGERVRHANRRPRVRRLAVVDDLAVAGREIEMCRQRFATGIACGEAHRVAVLRERLVDMENHVRRRIERNVLGAVEWELALGADARRARAERARIDGVGSVAAKACEDRSISSLIASIARD